MILFRHWQRFCEVVIELYYQEVWLVLDNIYMRICLVYNYVTDQGLPIQHNLHSSVTGLPLGIGDSKAGFTDH